jgi:hypothetical protein
MKPIPDDLLHDILDDAAPDSFSASTLNAMLTRLQRKKAMRRRLQMACAGGLLTALAVVAALTMPRPSRVAQTPFVSIEREIANTQVSVATAPATPAAAAPKDPREITDEQLLALFPGQAVGFIGTGEHREFFMAGQAPRGDKSR